MMIKKKLYHEPMTAFLRFSTHIEFVGWVSGSEELFLPFKILFLLDTRDPCIEEPFFGGSGGGGGGGIIDILGSQLWKNGRFVVKASTRRSRFSNNSSLL